MSLHALCHAPVFDKAGMTCWDGSWRLVLSPPGKGSWRPPRAPGLTTVTLQQSSHLVQELILTEALPGRVGSMTLCRLGKQCSLLHALQRCSVCCLCGLQHGSLAAGVSDRHPVEVVTLQLRGQPTW